MKRTTRSFEIADPFYTALETMSREMNVDRDTLVNQALFALARLHGFIVPTVISLDGAPGIAAPAKPPPPAPELEVTAPRRAVAPAPVPDVAPEVPISASPTSVAPALGNAPVAKTAVAEKPDVDIAALRAAQLERMAQIAEDVDSMVVPVEPPADEDEDDDEDEGDDDEEGDQDADDSDDDEASDEPDADESGEHSKSGEDEPPSEDEDEDDEPADEDEDEADDEDDDEADEADEPAERDADTQAEPLSGESPAPATSSHDEVEPTVDRTVMVRPSNSLKVWVQADDGGEVQVAPGRFVIGRGDNCNLVIDSLRVSREHASVQIVGKEVIIEDLGSSNGTWYNGEKVDRRLVVNGDEIVLGNERVRFRIES